MVFDYDKKNESNAYDSVLEGAHGSIFPFSMALPEDVESLINMLVVSGFGAFVVGGCVRDYALGVEPNDYDIASNATPDEIRAVFASIPDVSIYSNGDGEKYGTVIIVKNGYEFEHTTFRADIGYSDGRHPDSVKYTGRIIDDLARRDFTINALAYAPSVGLVDPFGGLNDLLNRSIKAVGDPIQRFDEDALRVLRAIRFAARLEYNIDDKTAEAARERASRGLESVSGPRIGKEIMKLMSVDDDDAIKRVLLDYPEIIVAAIPELEPQIGYDQETPHHVFSLYEHSARACALVGKYLHNTVSKQDVAPVALLRLTALLHDVGKPSAKVYGDDGIAHYYRHGEIGSGIADMICKRLGIVGRELVVKLIEFHDTPMSGSRKRVGRVVRALGEACGYNGMECLASLIVVRRCNVEAHGTYNPFPMRHVDEFVKCADEIVESGDAFSIRDLAVNGNDVMEALELVPGPSVGMVLSKLLDAVVSGEVANDRFELLNAARNAHDVNAA